MATILHRLTELSVAAHKNSVEHGFWDPAPPLYMSRALLHSEVAEALEDVRAHSALGWLVYNMEGTVQRHVVGDPARPVGQKPNGVPSEIADVAIRALDLAGRRGVEFTTVPVAEAEEAMRDCYEATGPASSREDPVFWLDAMHGAINDIQEGRGSIELALVQVFCLCEIFAQHVGKFDLASIVEEKMAYNASRPHKHGGKKF